MKIKGSLILITGGGSGIGEACAREFSARRAGHIVIADLLKDRAEKVATEINAAGCPASWVVVDVADRNQVKKMIDQTIQEHGHLDIMMNNAGIGIGGRADEVPVEKFEKVIQINLLGVIYGTKFALDYMVKRGDGHVVNTASAMGFLPAPYLSSYCASKSGIIGFSQSIRDEMKPFNIRVSVVCPGAVETPILDESERINMPNIFRIYPLMISSAHKVAKRIAIGIEKNQFLIIPTMDVKLIIALTRYFPGIQRAIGKFLGRDLLRRRRGPGDR